MGGLCSSEPVCISRTQPAAMSAHMPSVAWDLFCNQIDEVLKPLESIKQRTRIGMGLGFAFFIGIEIIFFSSFARTSTSNPSSPTGGPPLMFFMPVIGFACLVIAIKCTQVRTQAQAKEVLSELERVCGDTSNKFSSLSFHVRMEYIVVGRSNSNNNVQSTNHIEVSIANPEVGASAAGVPAFGLEASSEAYPASSPYFPAASSPYVPAAYPITVPIVSTSAVQHKSLAERLGDLEGLKGIISTEEYERKRKDILDGI